MEGLWKACAVVEMYRVIGLDDGADELRRRDDDGLHRPSLTRHPPRATSTSSQKWKISCRIERCMMNGMLKYMREECCTCVDDDIGFFSVQPPTIVTETWT